MKSQMGVTLVLLAILGAIFLKGFKEAINVAVVLVGSYLALNVVVTAVAIREVLRHSAHLAELEGRALRAARQPAGHAGDLADSVSQTRAGAFRLRDRRRGHAADPGRRTVTERVRNTRKLLLTAAAIMSVFLIATSMVTTLLIPAGGVQRRRRGQRPRSRLSGAQVSGERLSDRSTTSAPS